MAVIIEIGIVIDKQLVLLHFFNNRVTAALDVDDITVIDRRTAVFVFFRRLSKRLKKIKPCNRMRCFLNPGIFRRQAI